MSLPRPLIERFVRHLAEVQEDVARLHIVADTDGGAREDLRSAAHKLAGTAGGYGFPEVGERAREVEQRLVSGAAWTEAADAAVGALRNALAQATERFASGGEDAGGSGGQA